MEELKGQFLYRQEIIEPIIKRKQYLLEHKEVTAAVFSLVKCLDGGRLVLVPEQQVVAARDGEE